LASFQVLDFCPVGYEECRFLQTDFGKVYAMRAFAQFMLSIGSISSLETSALPQILLLTHTDDDEDFEPEASELGQKLHLQLRQKSLHF
jgi:hypothetical protein